MNVIDQIESALPQVDNIPHSGVDKIGQRGAQEIAFWQGKKEDDNSVQGRLGEYWEGVDYIGWTPATPWSASFISFLLRDTGFKGSAAHYRYVESVFGGESEGWEAFSIPKNIGKLTLNPGDVLVRARGSGSPQSAEYYQTHGDVVWRITGGEAQLIGGNLSNTARVASKISVDSKNRPTETITGYKVILKKKKGSSGWLWGLLIVGAVAVAYTQRKRLTG